MRSALDLLRRRPDTAQVITGTVPLEVVESAMRALAEGRGGVKTLVDPRA
jgi:hypothetical protein